MITRDEAKLGFPLEPDVDVDGDGARPGIGLAA
jgi:hypothetical protein